MNRDVLILAPDAERYLPLLGELAAAGVRLQAAESAPRALEVYGGQAVLLGQPDLAAAVLERLPQVRWVQSTWAGVRPLLQLGRRDYLLSGVRGVFGPQMAEYVFGHVLAHELRLAERRERQRRREWWAARSGALQGRTLGVMGTGSIGRHVAGVGRAFGMRVVGYSRGGAPIEGFERVFASGALREFLAEPDYLVCVLPDTPETTHLLDAECLRCLRPGCVLVNVGRGNLLDEPALAAALRRGELAGAVLDVFEREPLPADSPLWDAPGLVLTAHVAAHSRPADIARLFAANYNRFVAGEALQHLIDFERGY
jgi:phosphoglycerate dehydrogenase-like enzyme